MQTIKVAIFISSLFFLGGLKAQNWEDSLIVSGNFLDVSFDEFISTFEAQTGAHFFYDKEWTDTLVLNFGGTRLKFKTIFNEYFKQNKFTYYCKKPYVFILRSEHPINQLIFKNIEKKEENLSSNGDQSIPITKQEQRYRNALTQTILDTIIVGNKSKSVEKRAQILGKIKDSQTNESIIGATLYIEELQTGYVSNLDGFFNINIAPGKYNAKISYLTKKDKSIHFIVYSDGIFTIEMNDKVVPIKELTVVRTKYSKLNSTNTGVEHLETNMLSKLPVLLGEQDLLKAIQMLPGVVSGGEGTGGFYVRGSNADQNLIYFNKVPIYNTNHLFGFFSGFNSNAISDLTLYKSNIPAEYGGRLASILDINAKKGNIKRFNLKGGVSPITANALIEGPILKDKGSFIVGLRSSYSDYLLSRLDAPAYSKSSAGFYDYTFSTNFDLGENNELSAFAYYSHDDFDLSNINDYEYQNFGTSINLTHQFKPLISGELTLVASRYNFLTNNSTSISRAYSQKYLLGHNEIKLRLNYYKLDNHIIKVGIDGILYQLDRGKISPYNTESSLVPEINLGQEAGLESAAYISDQITINTWLSASLGLRYSFFGSYGERDVNIYTDGKPKEKEYLSEVKHYGRGERIASYSYPEFRLAAKANLNNSSSIKLSFNQMSQYLFMLSNTNAITPSDQWKLSDNNIKPQRANQISIGYYYDLQSPALTSSVELYGKRTSNIVDYKDGAELIFSQNMESEILQGRQDAYGAEFMVQKQKGRLTGWLSYAYSRSIITINGDEQWNKINGGQSYPSVYDKPHSMNFTTSFKINRRLSISSNLVYATGRPITYPKNLFYIENIPFVNYSSRNEYRIPDYFRLDASINFEGNLKRKKLFHSWWSFGVYNMTGRRNAYSVFFKEDDLKLKSYKLSVIGAPIITLSWNFKLGNYANN